MKYYASFIACLVTGFTFSTPELANKISQQEYVDQWKSVAIEQMISHKIPASITMAQGILESGNGNSVLALKGNNHFGIKCHEWTGEKIYVDDDKKNECFRLYSNGMESYEDHSKFLTGRSRYAKLFTLETTDYKGWAQGLKDAGYATNPKYPQLLIDLIERLKLHELDKMGSLNTNPSDYIASSSPKASGTSSKSQKFHKNTVKTSDNTKTKQVLQNTHTVMLHENKVRYIVAKKGDTFYRIAREYDMGLWQLYKYNDFGNNKDYLEEGDIVYLQPKRHKSKMKKVYTVSAPTTLRAISQLEGVKLSSLIDKNTVSSPDEMLQKGEKIMLK